MRTVRFVDAQEMARKYSETFTAPSLAALAIIEVGDYVMVCAEGESLTGRKESERFWTLIKSIEGDDIVARVENHLVKAHIHGLVADQLIRYKKSHIYKILE